MRGASKMGCKGRGATASALWLLCLTASPALAEEELRIALQDDLQQIRIGGERLALFDGVGGDALQSFDRDVTIQVSAGASGLRIDGRAAGTERLFATADGAVRVGRGVYFGRVEVAPDPKHAGRLLVMNRLPLETYLLGIVGSEMSPAWPIEALKAQAVAARTYAMQRRAMMRAANRPYDLASSVISQVYKGAERIRPSVIEAVRATRGEVMSHHHELAEALFHSTCGGRTVPAARAFGGDVPYLVQRSCDWCRPSSRYRWSLTFSVEEISRRLRRSGLTRGDVRRVDRRVEERLVRIEDARGERRAEPRDIRRALGFGKLFSERFSAETDGGRVRFAGRGFGHGVGMCQWGARGQALEGRTYRQILAHYYPTVRIKRLY